MNEFSTQLRGAIDAFTAPPVPLTAINERSSKFQAPGRKPMTSLYGALILTCSAAAVALGAQAMHQVAVTFGPSGAAIETLSLVCRSKNVPPALVSYVSALAAYHMTLPTGLPPGSTVMSMCSAGPNVLELSYTYPRRDSSKGGFFDVLIARPKEIAISSARLPVRTSNNGGRHWMIGSEEALVLATTLTNAQIDRVEQSMKYAAQNHCYNVTRDRKKIRIPCPPDT